MKFCVKCGDPIQRTVLADAESERCACCGDEPDGLTELKQEAYAEGWSAALEARDQEDRNEV